MYERIGNELVFSVKRLESIASQNMSQHMYLTILNNIQKFEGGGLFIPVVDSNSHFGVLEWQKHYTRKQEIVEHRLKFDLSAVDTIECKYDVAVSCQLCESL